MPSSECLQEGDGAGYHTPPIDSIRSRSAVVSLVHYDELCITGGLVLGMEKV